MPLACAIRLRTFRPLPEHRAGAVAVELDDEQAALLRVALELLGDSVPLVPAAGGEERADGLVGVEAGEEVEVVRRRRDGARRSWPGGDGRAPRQADGAGGERDAAEDQRQPDEGRGRDLLVQDASPRRRVRSRASDR